MQGRESLVHGFALSEEPLQTVHIYDTVVRSAYIFQEAVQSSNFLTLWWLQENVWKCVHST